MNNNGKQTNITVQFSLVQGFYWMGFACLSGFSSLYMLSLGISNTLIGITLSLGAFISAIAQPLVGMLIDTSKKVTTKMVLIISSILIVAISLLLYPVSKGAPAIVPVMYVFLICMLMLEQPFSNSIGVAAINAGYKLYFGPARAIGSLAFAIIAYILGKVSEVKGSTVIPAFIAITFVFAIFSLIIYPLKEKSFKSGTDNEVSDNEQDSDSPVSKPSIKSFFTKYKSFGVIIIGLIFIYFSHVIINSFNLQIISSKGGSGAEMGTATAISAALEIIPMFLFPIIIKKIKMSALLKLSAVFFALKVLVTLLAPNVTAYYAAQGCQTLGFGIMAVAIVYYVNDLVNVSDTAQGQAYAGMALTVGNVLGNISGGKIIDSLGINILLIIGLIAACIGAIIFWIGVNMSEKNH